MLYVLLKYNFLIKFRKYVKESQVNGKNNLTSDPSVLY